MKTITIIEESPQTEIELAAVGLITVRIAEIVGAKLEEVIKRVETWHLIRVPVEAWPAQDARIAARELAKEFEGRRCLLIGQRVAHAFGLASRERGRKPALLWGTERCHAYRLQLAVLPHPMRDGYWYTDPSSRDALRSFLLDSLWTEAERSRKLFT